MKKQCSWFVSFVLLLTLVQGSIVAQDRDPDGTEPLVRELAGIQRSLDELVVLLGAMRRNQDADLILRRIEMHERRLAPIESQLEGNKREQIERRGSLGNIEEWKKQTEERIDEIERDGREEVPIDIRQELRMADQGISREQARIEALERQQLELEDRIADRRDDIEVLEELLRERVE